MKVTYEIENGKKVRVEKDNGIVCKYDAKGFRIYSKESNGFEEWYERNSDGYIVHYKTNDGRESWCEYDANNKMIHLKAPWTGTDWFADDYEERKAC